ncbi:YihY family inner membrane protein [bacterium]|jgi:membrane protein|nr:YihY family inner membrane protein [bacterium]
MKKFLETIKRAPRFFLQEIWRLPLYRYKPMKAFGIRLLRIFALTGMEFGHDRCTLRATALTLYSLLAIVPLLAISFAIARGFNLQDTLLAALENTLLARFDGNQELTESVTMVFSYVTEAAQHTLETTKFGAMAGIGVLILLWTVIKLLGNIEFSFNDIFGGVKSRSFGRKIIDYCAIIILLPFLLILSTTLTVFLESQANFIVEKLPFMASLSPSMHFLIELVPYVLIWLGFIFLYLFVPNCKVKFLPGVIAGIAAGTVFNIVLWFYFAFQVGMAKNSAIYGAFAAVPLFIAWLQVSWTIVLCGAELAYAIQTHGYYEPRDLTAGTSLTLWFAIYIHVMGSVSRALIAGKEPQTARQLAEERHLPVQLVQKALNVLTDSGLLKRLEKGDDYIYIPLCAVESLTVGQVLKKIQSHGNMFCPGLEGEKFKELIAALQTPSALVKEL